MSVRLVNKPISETSGTSVLSCVSSGSYAAGTPVGIYIASDGVRTARKSPMTSASVNSGLAIDASTATGDVTDIAIGGEASVAVTGGTAGQFITNITVAGTCTTAAITSANTGLVGVLGTKVSTLEVILY